jgi:hypothetical protein
MLLGLGAMLISPQRMLKVAVAVRPATLLRFHRALVRRKYQWLFSACTRRRPGPKGPSKAVVRNYLSRSFLAELILSRTRQRVLVMQSAEYCLGLHRAKVVESMP